MQALGSWLNNRQIYLKWATSFIRICTHYTETKLIATFPIVTVKDGVRRFIYFWCPPKTTKNQFGSLEQFSKKAPMNIYFILIERYFLISEQ